jgi:hypothetical protein
LLSSAAQLYDQATIGLLKDHFDATVWLSNPPHLASPPAGERNMKG